MQKQNKKKLDEYILLTAVLLFGITSNSLVNFWFKLIEDNQYRIWVTGVTSFLFMILAIVIIMLKFKKVFSLKVGGTN